MHLPNFLVSIVAVCRLLTICYQAGEERVTEVACTCNLGEGKRSQEKKKRGNARAGASDTTQREIEM